MENKLTKKYGLFTAICMVVGIVIGSGIFFKTQNVLNATAGNALMGVLAWVIGGSVMAVLAVTFGVMATKYEKVGGVVDYAEATVGKTYAYYLGWFMATIYYPAMTSVLAWVSARYTLAAVTGADSLANMMSPECMALAAVYLIAIYFMNALAPKLAGKFQVSTTVIKLIPIFFIAIVGTIIGLVNGNLVNNFGFIVGSEGSVFEGEGSLFTAICCTVFAFEGWIIATAINAEIKDAKKNLPIALGIGAAIIVVAYVLYYLGILGLADMNTLGDKGTTAAFSAFGPVIATIINVLIIVSCLGTLNGLMLGCTRGFYALAARNNGIAPETLDQVDKKTNMPHNSASLALLVCILWFAYFVGGQFFGWFGSYAFDSSELPIVTIYPLYVPILIVFMIKAKDVHPFKRFVLPILSIIGAGIIVAASIVSHKMANVWYLIVFAVIMAIGALFYRGKGPSLMDKLIAKLTKKTEDSDSEKGEELPEEVTSDN
ncbi:MAG: APC family permease [Clostridia bacterium]|nr:APC family permease [Clostridia bacterium]